MPNPVGWGDACPARVGQRPGFAQGLAGSHHDQRGRGRNSRCQPSQDPGHQVWDFSAWIPRSDAPDLAESQIYRPDPRPAPGSTGAARTNRGRAGRTNRGCAGWTNRGCAGWTRRADAAWDQPWHVPARPSWAPTARTDRTRPHASPRNRPPGTPSHPDAERRHGPHRPNPTEPGRTQVGAAPPRPAGWHGPTRAGCAGGARAATGPGSEERAGLRSEQGSGSIGGAAGMGIRPTRRDGFARILRPPRRAPVQGPTNPRALTSTSATSSGRVEVAHVDVAGDHGAGSCRQAPKLGVLASK